MKTKHKANGRAHSRALPKFWRPKLSARQVLDARIVHHDLLDRLVRGQASIEDCWDWMETGFTYAKMMWLLAEDGVVFTDEAKQALILQLQTYEPICERLRRTGRVGLSGPQLVIARNAAAVMDELVGMDRHGIAQQAALWSLQQMARVRKGV